LSNFKCICIFYSKVIRLNPNSLTLIWLSTSTSYFWILTFVWFTWNWQLHMMTSHLKYEIWSLKFEIWKFSCNYVSNLERISSSQVSYCEHTWFLLTNATFKNYSVNRNSQVGYKQYEQSILYSGETMDHLYSTALCRINGCPLKSHAFHKFFFIFFVFWCS
jgi:hypothetical protein